jgi:hypothetical protein
MRGEAGRIFVMNAANDNWPHDTRGDSDGDDGA